MWHVAHVVQIINAYKTMVGKVEKRSYLIDLDVDIAIVIGWRINPINIDVR
jgi:hypothetical protein